MVFISNAIRDRDMGTLIYRALVEDGIPCWIAAADVAPGDHWSHAISEAINKCEAFVILVSPQATESQQMMHEVRVAYDREKPVIPVKIEQFDATDYLKFAPVNGTILDATGSLFWPAIEQLKEILLNYTKRLEPLEQTDLPSEGAPGDSEYVFISYLRIDGDFVERLRGVLATKGYSYWDYLDGERNFHGALYRELEERIDNAVAFITIVTDNWRNSDWVASEYIYAKEAGKPIFVIQAKALEKPLPILLNLQTRIDMSDDFDSAATILRKALEKKGL